MVTAIGVFLVFGGGVLYLNLAGAATFVIKNLTSRSLGSLAPGYAASPSGFRVYASLLASIGVVLIGLGTIDRSGSAGLLVALLGTIWFVALSVAVIAGEVSTYRALKR